MDESSGESPVEELLPEYTGSESDTTEDQATDTGRQQNKEKETPNIVNSDKTVSPLLHARTSTEQMDRSEEKYVCEHCGYRTNHRSHLTGHLKTGEKPFECDLCDFSTPYKCKKSLHVLEHTGKKPFVCEECGYRTACSPHFTQHISRKHNIKTTDMEEQQEKEEETSCSVNSDHSDKEKDETYVCEHCGYWTNHRSHLTGHFKTGKKPFKCDQCDFSTPYRCKKNLHMVQHTGEKLFECDKCSYRTTSRFLFEQHLSRKHTIQTTDTEKQQEKEEETSCSVNSDLSDKEKDETYVCEHCGYWTNHRSHLTGHLKTGEKPFKCDLCDFSTPYRCKRNLHVLEHTREKPYVCVCEYSYRTASRFHFDQHLSSRHAIQTADIEAQQDMEEETACSVNSDHSDKEQYGDYVCEHCGYRTRNRAHLTRHLETGKKPYKCDQCDFSTPYRCKNNLHIHEHTGEKLFECEECSYRTASGFCFDQHLSIKHNIQTTDMERQQKKREETSCSVNSDHSDKEKRGDYVCEQCGYKTRCGSSFREHLKTVKHLHFKCEECGYATVHRDLLIQHLKEHAAQTGGRIKKINYVPAFKEHTVEKPFTCDQCDFSCTRKCNLVHHMQKHTGEAPYMCEECGYRTVDRFDLANHVAGHEKTVFRCDQCDFSTAWKDNLDQHIFKHTGVAPYKCKKCGYETASRSDLSQHRKRHASEKPLSYDQSDVSTAQEEDVDQGLPEYPGVAPYKCKKCAYETASRCDLSQHRKTHTSEKPLSCDQSDVSTAQEEDVDQGIPEDTGEAPYKCKECGYETASRSDLLQHRKTHASEKPLNSDESDVPNPTAQQEDSDLHMPEPTAKKRVASLQLSPRARKRDKKTFSCDECDYSTSKKQLLKKHMAWHAMKYYMCDECGYRTTSKFLFSRHLVEHTGVKIHWCDQCGFSTAQKDDFDQHMLSHPMETHSSDEGYRTTSKFLISQHLAGHTEVKIHWCDQCGFCTAQKDDFDQHMLSHPMETHSSDEEPYVCKDTESRLKQHMKTHTSQKPFKCDQCAFSTNQKVNMDRHRLRHRGEEAPYMCDLCGYGTTSRFVLSKHLRRHHDTEEKQLKCDRCDFSTDRKCNLVQHMRKHIPKKLYKQDSNNSKSNVSKSTVKKQRSHSATACTSKSGIDRHLLTFDLDDPLNI